MLVNLTPEFLDWNLHGPSAELQTGKILFNIDYRWTLQVNLKEFIFKGAFINDVMQTGGGSYWLFDSSIVDIGQRSVTEGEEGQKVKIYMMSFYRKDTEHI